MIRTSSAPFRRKRPGSWRWVTHWPAVRRWPLKWRISPLEIPPRSSRGGCTSSEASCGFALGRRNAGDDFDKAVKISNEAIDKYENFDPLDTLAFAHAGLALLGRDGHADTAVNKYQRARALASAAGIVDIGRTVFSCFGSNPSVKRLTERLFVKAF